MLQEILAALGILLAVLLLLLLLLVRPALAEPALEAYLEVPRYERPRWDPSGRRLAYLREGRLYVGERRMSDLAPVTAFFWTADGRALIAEVGPGRVYRIGESTERLSPPDQSWRFPVLKAGVLAASADDRRLVLLDLETRAVRLLYEGPGRPRPARFSPDGRSLLATSERSSLASDLLLLDLATGKARVLASGARFLEPRWRDARRISVLTDLGRDRLALRELHLESGAWTTRVEAPGEVEGYAERGGRLAYLVNEGNGSSLFLDGRRLPTPEGVIRSLAFRSRDGALTYWLSGPCHPPSAWVGSKPVLGGRTELPCKKPRRVVYPGAHGLPIPALLYEGGPRAVVMLHGGPANQSRPEWSPLLQALAAGGHTLLLPDYRGSSGYGRSFLAADDGHLRSLAVDDVVQAGRWLRARGHSRVALAGFSYGGFLALAALAKEPELFSGAVSLAGISDLAGFVESQPGRREGRRSEFGDDTLLLSELSPLGRRFTRPVLLLHGEADERVPVEDARRFAAELERTGAPVELLLLPGEGHGLQSSEARRKGYRAILAFLARVTAP